ncbi:MAG: DMT family transporter [Deinococcota bacterium]
MTLPVMLSMIVLVVLWGSAFPAIKLALTGMTPGHFTLLRFIAASLCFIIYGLVRRKRLLPAARDLGYVFLLSVLGVSFYHSALNFGQAKVSAGAASLIIATAPAMSAALASLLLHEYLPKLAWGGLAVSLAGVGLIVLGNPSSADTTTSPTAVNPYALLILAAALSTAFFVVLQKPMLKRYSSLDLAGFITVLGTLPLIIFAPGLLTDLADASPVALGAAIYAGIFPAALCYVIFAYALANTSVAQVTTMLYLVPVVSTLFAWFLLGEVPTQLTFIGGFVALLGVLIVQQTKRKAISSSP